MKKIADGVWLADPGIVVWRAADIEFLEHEAKSAAKKRARICLHQPEERVHQMLIAFCAGSENPWHEHDRMEAALVLKGKFLVEFHDRVVFMYKGDSIRIPAATQHKPTPLTDCVILETAEK